MWFLWGKSGLPICGRNHWLLVNIFGLPSPLTFENSLDLVRPTEGEPSPFETDQIIWQHCRDGSNLALWKLNGIGHAPFFNRSWLEAALDFVDQ